MKIALTVIVFLFVQAGAILLAVNCDNDRSGYNSTCIDVCYHIATRNNKDSYNSIQFKVHLLGTIACVNNCWVGGLDAEVDRQTDKDPTGSSE